MRPASGFVQRVCFLKWKTLVCHVLFLTLESGQTSPSPGQNTWNGLLISVFLRPVGACQVQGRLLFVPAVGDGLPCSTLSDAVRPTMECGWSWNTEGDPPAQAPRPPHPDPPVWPPALGFWSPPLSTGLRSVYVGSQRSGNQARFLPTGKLSTEHSPGVNIAEGGGTAPS